MDESTRKQADGLLTDMAAWNIRLEKEWERLIAAQEAMAKIMEEKSKPERPAMEPLYIGKPIKRSPSSLAFSVPKFYCETAGINEDTEIRCYIANNAIIFKYGDKTPEAQP